MASLAMCKACKGRAKGLKQEMEMGLGLTGNRDGEEELGHDTGQGRENICHLTGSMAGENLQGPHEGPI